MGKNSQNRDFETRYKVDRINIFLGPRFKSGEFERFSEETGNRPETVT